MKIATDERLSILKQYAKKHFGLTRNVKVLVLLISEKEREKLLSAYRKTKEYLVSKGRKIKVTIPPPEFRVHGHQEFFPEVAPAGTFHLRKGGIKTEIINRLWKIIKFRKYEYVTIIREEKLEDYARKKIQLTKDSDIPDTHAFAQLGFCFLLCHEFLHVVELETKRVLYEGDERDNNLVKCILSKLPQSYWKMCEPKGKE